MVRRVEVLVNGRHVALIALSTCCETRDVTLCTGGAPHGLQKRLLTFSSTIYTLLYGPIPLLSPYKSQTENSRSGFVIQVYT